MLKLGITFNGKLMKPNKDYQYPPLIKIAWFNLLEGDQTVQKRNKTRHTAYNKKHDKCLVID